MNKYLISILTIFVISCSSNTIDQTSKKVECNNQCLNEGTLFCENGSSYICEIDQNGCLKKRFKELCRGDQTCIEGVCVISNCENDCNYIGERVCNFNGYEICGNFDQDICLETKFVECSEDTTCINGYCLNNSDPCQGITCSNHGVCEVQNDQPICICDNGYVQDGLNCISDIDCDPECDQWEECISGNCVLKNGYCYSDNDCSEDGYICNVDTHECYYNDPCFLVDCMPNSYCDSSTGEPICVCYEGYVGENCDSCDENYIVTPQGTCVLCEDPCELEDMKCDGRDIKICATDSNGCNRFFTIENCSEEEHLICTENSGQFDCGCEDGYQLNNGECIAMCAITDCGENGICDDSSGVPICNCQDSGNLHYYGDSCENSCIQECQMINSRRCKPDNIITIQKCEMDENGCKHWVDQSQCDFNNHKICDENESGLPECVCDDGFDNCNGDCVNRETDVNNCGECGYSCEVDQSCVDGDCIISYCQDDIFENNDTIETAKVLTNGIYEDLKYCYYYQDDILINDNDWYKIEGYLGTIRVGILYPYSEESPENRLILKLFKDGDLFEEVVSTPLNNGYAYIEYFVGDDRDSNYYLELSGNYQESYTLIVDNSYGGDPNDCNYDRCIISYENGRVDEVNIGSFYKINDVDYGLLHCTDYDHNGCYSLRKEGVSGSSAMDHLHYCGMGYSDLYSGLIGCVGVDCDDDHLESDNSVLQLYWDGENNIYETDLNVCNATSDLYYFSVEDGRNYQIEIEYSGEMGDLNTILYEAEESDNIITIDFENTIFSTLYPQNNGLSKQFISFNSGRDGIVVLKIYPTYRDGKSSIFEYSLDIKRDYIGR